MIIYANEFSVLESSWPFTPMNFLCLSARGRLHNEFSVLERSQPVMPMSFLCLSAHGQLRQIAMLERS
jgi:hypothetical protein